MGRWLLGMTVTFLFVCRYQAKRDPTLYCSACRALVDELNHSIEQVDPKRTIRVGGFRLDPDGSMKDKKVPLARSETHLNELLDGVCNSMSDYALHVDPATQRKQYLRFAPRSGGGGFTGDFPDLQNFQFTGPQAPDALKFACEIIVEDLEDDIIALFSQSSEDPQRQLCNVVSDYCNDTSDRNDEL